MMRPCGVLNAVLRPPGVGEASSSSTSAPASTRALAAPKPAQPPPTTATLGLLRSVGAGALDDAARAAAWRRGGARRPGRGCMLIAGLVVLVVRGSAARRAQR
jgi:hypothetical protein